MKYLFLSSVLLAALVVKALPQSNDESHVGRNLNTTPAGSVIHAARGVVTCRSGQTNMCCAFAGVNGDGTYSGSTCINAPTDGSSCPSDKAQNICCMSTYSTYNPPGVLSSYSGNQCNYVGPAPVFQCQNPDWSKRVCCDGYSGPGQGSYTANNCYETTGNCGTAAPLGFCCKTRGSGISYNQCQLKFTADNLPRFACNGGYSFCCNSYDPNTRQANLCENTANGPCSIAKRQQVCCNDLQWIGGHSTNLRGIDCDLKGTYPY